MCVNAGDSRCVLGIGGKAVPMSIDHKPALAGERQRILKAGSTINAEGRIDGNLNLSRAIGDLRYKKNKNLAAHEHPVTAFPDIKKMQMSSAIDFAIIGCDGIWETKTSQQVVDFVYMQMKKKISIPKICETILDWLVSPNISRTGNFFN
jgi:serine/threonine protein phosphatase PrpC